jgi:hypothetical protein
MPETKCINHSGNICKEKDIKGSNTLLCSTEKTKEKLHIQFFSSFVCCSSENLKGQCAL